MRYLVFLICIFSINLKSEVYEIRDYTIEEEWFEAYVYWAENHFMPYGNARIEIIEPLIFCSSHFLPTALVT